MCELFVFGLCYRYEVFAGCNVVAVCFVSVLLYIVELFFVIYERCYIF